MGFMDKAKKMAEQAQAKLEEAQKQFNESQSSGPQPPPVEYDQHGRPIRSEAPPEPAAPPAPEAAAPPAESATPPHGDPLAREPDTAEDRNHPSYAPPKLSSGDPLAG
jgi:formin 2/WAS/WASL-interacting protein